MTNKPPDFLFDDAVIEALTRMIVRKVLDDIGLRTTITRTVRGGGGGGGGGGGSTVPDATATVKGKLRLAGDFGGTAALPILEAIQGVVITGTPALDDILTATGPTAAHWAPPAHTGFAIVFDSLGGVVLDGDGDIVTVPA